MYEGNYRVLPNIKKTRDKLSTSQQSYPVVRKFEDANAKIMLTKRNYKAAITIELNSSRRRPKNCLPISHAGLSLQCENTVRPDWTSLIFVRTALWLRGVTNPEVEVVGTKILLVHMWETRACFVFWILKSLAVPSFCEALFMVKLVEIAISPKGR